MLERRPGEPRIVEAEDDGALVRVGERRELRVVAVDEQHGLGGQTAHGLAPALCDQLELAVAVELVPEEIAEADRAGSDSP